MDRLIIQGHRNPEKTSIVNEAATILRSSICIILIMSAMFDFEGSSRDLIQDFVQSDDIVGRLLFIQRPDKPEIIEK